MYKVFVFDLGNVIIPFDHSTIAPRLIKYSRRIDIYSASDIHKFFYRVEEVEHLYEEGKITTAEFIKRVKEKFELDISDEEFKNIFNDIFFNTYPYTERVIKDIKSEKFPLILLSNTNEMHFEFIKSRYEIIKYFDQYILSYKEGFRKPDRRIYEKLLKIANCKAEEIFYTDDMPDYVKAAEGSGISAYLFTSPEKLYFYLKSVVQKLKNNSDLII